MRRTSPPLTWTALVRALKSPVMNYGGIAKEIENMPVSENDFFCCTDNYNYIDF